MANNPALPEYPAISMPGTGIRNKSFTRIYIGALYLKKPKTHASRAPAAKQQQCNVLLPDLPTGGHAGMHVARGAGTTPGIDDKVPGRSESDGFFRAMLQVWIGEHPEDRTLKTESPGR